MFVIFQATARPGHAAELATLFDDTLGDTRSFDGCNSVIACRSQDDEHRITLIEDWRDRAAYDAYLGWRAGRGDMEKLAALVVGEPRIEYLDTMN